MRRVSLTCAAAGEGGTLALSLGGKSDGMPFACSARVLKLTDGRFTLTGPMGAGNPGNLGPCALIDIDGVRVMVVSHKMQALDQAILRHVGVEPSECPILVLKSSVHFRADFGPIAEKDHRGHRARPGGRRSGDPEFPLRTPRGCAAARTPPPPAGAGRGPDAPTIPFRPGQLRRWRCHKPHRRPSPCRRRPAQPPPAAP